MNLYSALTTFFERQTRLVCQWPLLFLALPLAITGFLLALALQSGNLEAGKQNLDVFLPDSMPSLLDLKELLRLFPPQSALRDSYSLFGSSFAYVIFEDISQPNGGGNILEPSRLKEVTKLHKMILHNVTTKSGLRFSDVCFREDNSTCTQHPILVALEDSEAILAVRLLARYPTLRLSASLSIDNAIVFGGVQLSPNRVDKHGNAAILAARAIRLFYVLDSGPGVSSWIRAFLKEMSRLQMPGAVLHFTSSQSLTSEMERNGQLLVPWMPWMVGLLIGFCGLICAKFGDPVGSQPFIGLGAMLNAFLAIVSAIATLVYIDYPFLHMILIMPFLILSIGVDNMFLMLRSWRSLNQMANRRLKGLLSADAIFVEAIADVSVSIFVTSLTDGLSFAIGTFSDFMAVRVFCTYCWLAILFMFLYQCTFFTALMALHCRREHANRHWLLCCLKMEENPSTNPNFTFCSSGQLCCQSQFYKHSATLIQHPATKAATLMLYLLYLFGSAYWISKLELGLDLKLLTPDGSHVAREFGAQERLFSDYGPFGYCVIHVGGNHGDNNSRSVALWERNERDNLVELFNRMTSGPLVSKGDFWLQSFQASNYSQQLQNNWDGQTQELFVHALLQFLQDQRFAKYRSDIRLNESTGQLEAIKMSLRIRKMSPANDIKRVEFLRSTLAQSGYQGFVYDATFLLVDQQTVTRHNVLANVLVAIGVMLAISAIFVPRPLASLSVALTILSINIGVVGALSAARTRLDIVSMITIVMSVGLSFDYATHFTFHFLLFRHDRVENSLRAVGLPILQAAMSTLLGVSVLGLVPSYMVRTFVLTVLFVVSLGLVHALFFLPVLLHFVVPDSEYLSIHSSLLSIRALQQLAVGNGDGPSGRRGNSVVYFY